MLDQQSDQYRQVIYLKRKVPRRHRLYQYYEVHQAPGGVAPDGDTVEPRMICQVVVSFLKKNRPMIFVQERPPLIRPPDWWGYEPGIPIGWREFQFVFQMALNHRNVVLAF